MSRRHFLGRAATAGAAFSIVPGHVLGLNGQTPPSGRVNLAFVGVGSQGLRVMFGFLKQGDVQGVAVCDPVLSAADYPQWSENEFRDATRNLLGTNSGWEWLSPNKPIQLTRTLRCTSGVAGREPAQKIINALYGQRIRSGNYQGCGAYKDYRELLDKEKDVDAVVVGTTDHWHALVSVAAMKRHKHVYCQKPMAHDVHEARRMGEVARETGVATQVAVGPQASEDTRVLCEMLWSGAIGPVRQVCNWSSRPLWPQGLNRPAEVHPVPDGFDWDLWLGPAAERPFNHAYLPFVWRGWHDFGCGALGDMGCYSLDVIFRALKLETVSAVEAFSSGDYPEAFPLSSQVRFEFPSRGDQPPVRLDWYDGGLRPWRPEEWETGQEWPNEGLMFVGDKGTVYCGFTGEGPKLIPEAKMRAYKMPPKTLPRSPGNEREWLDACKGGNTKPGANFEYSARVTEALLLGNVALRTGRKIHWDSAAMKAHHDPAAQALIKTEYRPGWSL